MRRYVHWCLGMYASGSTWLYNIAAQIAAHGHTEGGALQGFARRGEHLRVPPLENAPLFVLKTHDVDADAEDWLRPRARSIVVTIRDPREVIHSLMSYHNATEFEKALDKTDAAARVCTAWAGDERALLLRYENGFTTDPATVPRVARTMGYDLDAALYTEIFDAFRREAVDAQIKAMDEAGKMSRGPLPGDRYNFHSQWHLHHAGRTGETGAWRGRLTDGQLAAIEARLGDWMEEWGYALEGARGG